MKAVESPRTSLEPSIPDADDPITNSVPADAMQMQCMEVWGGNQAISSTVAMPGLTAWVYSRPFGHDRAESPENAGGGDIHYLTSCATGRISRLAVADVSGHGVTVMKAADALRRLMRKYSNYFDQSVFVESLNRRFAELAEQSDDDSVQPGAFATAVVATYCAPTDELAISNAGHPRPLVWRAESRAWSALAADAAESGLSNLPLGIDTPTRYPTTRLTLGPTDLVLLYSDSLIEAKDAGGRMLGERGLVEILNTINPGRPDDLIATTLKAITDRASDPGINDDVTVLLLSRNALKPNPSVLLSVQGAWRLLQHAMRSLRPGGLPISLPEFGLASLGGSMIARLNKAASAGGARRE